MLVDTDHAPDHLLSPACAGFSAAVGTRAVAAHLRPGEAFALWSHDPPAAAHLATLEQVLDQVRAEVVGPNPLQDRPATNTGYLATAR